MKKVADRDVHREGVLPLTYHETIYNTTDVLIEDYAITSGFADIDLKKQKIKTRDDDYLCIDIHICEGSKIIKMSDRDAFNLAFFTAADDDTAKLIMELGEI